LKKCAETSRPDIPLIILSHLNIEGIEVGSESDKFARGRDVFLDLEALREVSKKRPTIVLQGHYHKRQVLDNIYVVGSLCRLNFGEQENQPGYQIVEI
jgi:DNA repair exonuclease SbcCD nuclease subunit